MLIKQPAVTDEQPALYDQLVAVIDQKPATKAAATNNFLPKHHLLSHLMNIEQPATPDQQSAAPTDEQSAVTDLRHLINNLRPQLMSNLLPMSCGT